MVMADLWDWVFAGMFEEDAVSETKTRGLNTPWDRMSNAIHVGRIQIVVAVDLGRLLRTTRNFSRSPTPEPTPEPEPKPERRSSRWTVRST